MVTVIKSSNGIGQQQPTAGDKGFNAEEFVELLLKEGANVACDDTVDSFNTGDQVLPPFYDEEKFKRGQAFFHKHIFANFFCSMLGLITVLTIPSILRILILTKMSGTPMTAYKRYLATVFHMITWYDHDFKPGSKLWQSVCDVKSRHNSASKKSCNAGLNRINQKDMAITQFGFIGYAICRTELVGIHGVTEEDISDFIHVWRVLGYILGLQDRYNMCRESVEETRQICEVLVDKLFRPALERKDKDFMNMSRQLAIGMWSMNPFLSHPVLVYYAHFLLNYKNERNNNENNNAKPFIRLNFWGRLLLNFYHATMYLLRYNLFRLYQNHNQYVGLWLMKVFPFLAYYQFGYSNSHVTILNGDKDD